METKFETDVEVEVQYKTRVYDTHSRLFREWLLPKIIFNDLVNLEIEKDVEKFEKETKIAKYSLICGSIHIKRKDIYSTIGFAIPLNVVIYLIENKNRLR